VRSVCTNSIVSYVNLHLVARTAPRRVQGVSPHGVVVQQLRH